ncbi:hypothetical protein [Halalkalibacter oceani]|uniref:hypothetical protein n=1 Tax=Halalkalibacter oceani TaxID=1653776 RepID=UPI0033911A85
MSRRPKETKELKMCLKCLDNKRKIEDFYLSYSEWHGDARTPICKKCLKEKLNENDPSSVRNVLRAIDKPYRPLEWEKACKGKTDTLGTYLKNLGLNYKEETYDDSIFDNENNYESENRLEERKIYSKKWLGYYYPSEIEYLEEYLNGLDRDFKVVTLSHKDYAKKIAKASLHMDKCFQEMQEGVTNADKKYKEAKDIFDTLSKSAKFSESQRGINEVGLGSFSQIVDMVESNTYVYEHKNDLDKDSYDKLIDDFKHIYKSL